MILNLLGKLGGRSFIVTILNAILLPVLATVLPEAIVIQAVAALAAVASSFIFGNALRDGMTDGKTSTVANVKK